MEEWEALEWEQLRVVGKPLLSGAAFGATPLLWVACRAQPCLVHVFCDTQLQDIWRFPADPVFLSIGSGSRQGGNDEGAQSSGRLLVITRDGCIWIVQLSKTITTASRPSKRQKTVKTQKVGEIQRIKPVLAGTTIVEAPSGTPHVPGLRWKELDVETYTPSPRAIEVKNVLVADTLVGTVPGAKVAAFGPNNYVALGSPVGSPELLCVNRLAASHPEGAEYPISISGLRREPACLLTVSSVQHRQKHGPGDCQAVLSQDLFESLSSPSAGASDYEILLIQGGMNGRVSTFRMEKDTVVSPPHTVCDLHQPVVTIIPLAHLPTRSGSNSQMGATEGYDEVRGANWLIVIGVLGQVAFLSSVRDQLTMEEPNDGPFLARRNHTPTRVENTSRSLSILKELVSNEGVLSGPVTSACLVGGARLCYTVGSAVFISELFDDLESVLESGGVGSRVEYSRSSSSNMRADNSLVKLPCQRIPISNVAAITGPGLFTYNGTHSLVTLTGAGRLLSIKISKQFASPFSTGNLGIDCCQNSLKAYSGNCIKVSLQSIADAESCRNAIQNHEQALTLAMNELALALPRARDIATSKKNLVCKTSFRNNQSSSKEESATANVGLGCTLTAATVPSTSLGDDQLSFGGIGFGSLRKPSKFVDRNVHQFFKTRLDIALINHSRTPLSQYWSCILELQSCLSTASPASQYSFTINNGHGLPVGFQWNHRIHVNLPGGPWGPVMATMYLCHLHDSHQALLQNSRGFGLGRSGQNLGRASSAGCVVLLRQQIDLFSLLQGPQSTLGHTSWTPALSGNTNLKTKGSSLAGIGGTELLDLADADTLGSFSGDLAFSFSLDAKHNVSKPINNTADWQHAFLSNFLQQPASSTEWRRLRLTSQGGHTVAISVDGRKGQGGEYQSLVNIQTPCLLLGILLREALLCQIMGLDADPALGGNKKVVLHKNGSMNFVVKLNGIQALVERAREALNVWKKFQSHLPPTALDLVAPLLGHTYVVTGELIQAYKAIREEPSAALS
ncbi:hypothetical protein M758_4G050100 [Ceratodon purpureus]|nr:hypothetical protein M758_4G050100 [Ceratodon purpureus]